MPSRIPRYIQKSKDKDCIEEDLENICELLDA
jgi:hypothetical protein